MMSKFAEFSDLVAAEIGHREGERLLAKIRLEFGGARIVVPAPEARAPISDKAVSAALAKSGYAVERAAALLGVAPATIYRRLAKKAPRIQSPPPRRLVR